MTPFFDSRDEARIRLALNILNYSQHFCLKAENQQHLARLLPSTDGVRHLVETLRSAQASLAPHLPLSVESVWGQRDALSPSLVPTTVCKTATLPEASKSRLVQSLDRGLLESALERLADNAKGTVKADGLGLALACTWLSQHLALIAIGIAKAELTGNNELVITPTGEDAVKHLRRLWFAAAFEEMSLLKAHATLEVYSMLAAGSSKHLKGDVETAFLHALSVIPQHWRLPVGEGPVAKLLDRHLMPLIGLLGAVYQAAMFRGGKPVVQADVQPKPAFRQVFAEVLRQQRELLPMDRLFDVQNDGLVLGQRKLATGLLLMAEQIATKQLGPNWHDKQLSDVQKRYLIERLLRLDNVDVVDVEVMQHDTTDNVHVDVDLFVRDRQNDILFAVQLKHFEYSKKGGVLAWLERFRPAKLAHGIAQLEAISGLTKTDHNVRTKLLVHGITAEELQRVVPVVLHNIGILDCLAFQAGVLIYDQHTFVNVLDGRAAVGVGAVDGEAVHLNIPGSSNSCRLDDPDGVISAYVRDPHFAPLRHFDAMADTTRQLHVAGTTVRACGLGI